MDRAQHFDMQQELILNAVNYYVKYLHDSSYNSLMQLRIDF